MTFTDLSAAAQEDFKHYYRRGQLTVFTEATFNPEMARADLLQFGMRKTMPQFRAYFAAEKSGEGAQALDLAWAAGKRSPSLEAVCSAILSDTWLTVPPVGMATAKD